MKKCFAVIVLLIQFSLFGCSSNQSNVTPTDNQLNVTPTDTLKAFIQASKNKDVDRLKQILSKDSWEMMEEIAKEQGKTLEESIKEDSRGEGLEKAISEFGKETINGNEAVVEFKSSLNGKWGTMDLIKEDNKWKVNLTKPFKEAQELLNKELN